MTAARLNGLGHCNLGVHRGAGDTRPGNWLIDVNFDSSVADYLKLDLNGGGACGSCDDGNGDEDGIIELNGAWGATLESSLCSKPPQRSATRQYASSAHFCSELPQQS